MAVIALLVLIVSCVSCMQARDAIQEPLAIEAPSQRHLQLTAITHTDLPPYDSRIQCLNLTAHPFNSYPTVGESLFLSSVQNITYVVLPPRSEEGWHNPPHPMFFILLSGQARVVTPSTKDEVWIEPGGLHQLLLALDTHGKGHLTFYPSDEQTVALQAPLASHAYEEMKWEVINEGPCI